MKAWLWTASIMILLALVAQGGALAQDRLVVDCNIFFQNQENCPSGEARAGFPACADSFNTCDLINTIFPNNVTVDPQMVDPLNQFAPDFRVAAGGNATHLGGGPVGVVPADGFFQQTYFVGAMGSGPDEDWTKAPDGTSWCYYSTNGAGRGDLPENAEVVSGNITTNTTWSPANGGYLLSGTVRVLNGAILSIMPGTVVFGEQATNGTLIIEQGGQINAQGTALDPIIFTSDAEPGFQDRGQWGGVVLNGRAPVNCAAMPGGTCEGEGGSGTFGGNNPNDSSGTLRYVRIEFAGIEFSPDNELNALTQNGVGSGTTIEYVQCHRGFDDAFEWFGGTVNDRYLVATDAGDDHLDWQIGYRGKVQFAISRHVPDVTTADRGIEADNSEFGFDLEPRSNPTFANITIVGTGAAAPAGGRGITLRRGTAATIMNSIVFNTRRAGIDLDDNATFNRCWGDPCVLLSDQIGIAEQPAVGAARPLQVALSPNPFNPSTQIAFTLSRPGAARVGIYDGNGRLIDELAASELAAGRQALTWNAPAGISSGTYFYRVEASGQVATGKMHLVK